MSNLYVDVLGLQRLFKKINLSIFVMREKSLINKHLIGHTFVDGY